jgi:hypothetical protein
MTMFLCIVKNFYFKYTPSPDQNINKKAPILKPALQCMNNTMLKNVYGDYKIFFKLFQNSDLNCLFVYYQMDYRIHFLSKPLNASLEINSAPRLCRCGV